MTIDQNLIISQISSIVSTDANGAITGINSSGYSSNLGPVGNVTITGGSNGQVLSTNGSGNLSWSTVTSGSSSGISNGTSDMTVDGSGGSILANIAGNEVFRIRADGIITLGNTVIDSHIFINGNLVTPLIANSGVVSNSTTSGTIRVTGNGGVGIGGNLNVGGKSNLNAVGNITITGGSNGQYLQTNGNGVLSWANVSSGGSGLSGPAFVASPSSGSATVTNGLAIIPCNSASLNIGNCYNTTTYTFTPTTAGYYQIGASMKNAASQTFSSLFVAVYKNGSLFKILYSLAPQNALMTQIGFAGHVMVPMNGTTDYVTIQWYGTGNNSNNLDTIFIEGTYLRGLT